MNLTQTLPQDEALVLADGKTYTFSELHLNAQAAIEEKFGVSLMSTGDGGLQEFIEKLLSNTLSWRFLVYQLLRKYHRNLTEEDVGYLINPSNMESVYRVVLKQFVASFPIPEERKKEVLDLIQNQESSGNESLQSS